MISLQDAQGLSIVEVMDKPLSAHSGPEGPVIYTLDFSQVDSPCPHNLCLLDQVDTGVPLSNLVWLEVGIGHRELQIYPLTLRPIKTLSCKAFGMTSKRLAQSREGTTSYKKRVFHWVCLGPSAVPSTMFKKSPGWCRIPPKAAHINMLLDPCVCMG